MKKRKEKTKIISIYIEINVYNHCVYKKQ